jgi:hypothetical protein
VPWNWRQKFDTFSVQRNLNEVKALSQKYVVEQTIEPLKKLGRYAAFGCLGSLFVGLGSLFGLVGVLRLLQDETTAFTGDLSWLPYLAVVGLALVEIGLVLWAITSGPAKRRLPKKAPDQ